MRIRLTWEEAERGVKPVPYSREEWDAMNRAVDEYSNRELRRKLCMALEINHVL
jgi:hypothetical protein